MSMSEGQRPTSQVLGTPREACTISNDQVWQPLALLKPRDPILLRPMDLEDALAAFLTPGQIDSKVALDVAVSNLTTALQQSSVEIPSLLNTLLYHTSGLLEAVIASHDDGAFTFRTRILRALEKSSHHPHPVFVTCAERVGAFLIGLPPWIALDSSVLQEYNAFSASSTSPNPEAGDFIKKKEVPVKASTPKLKMPTKPKKKKRFVPLSLVTQDPPKEEPDNSAQPTATQRIPSSSGDVQPHSSTSESFSKQLSTCLEVYFTACLNETVEEVALDELFKRIVPTSQLSPLARSDQVPDAVNTQSPTFDAPGLEAVAALSPEPSHRSLLTPNQIAASLAGNIDPQSGEWLVVVSQKAIRQFQQYALEDRVMLGQVKTTTCQLSEGFFSPANYFEIVSREYGIPIYAANLGGGQRLVYQIDFGAPIDSIRESQFIRIFEVDSRVNTEFWRAASAQLALKGPKYVQSCVDREEARQLAKGAKSVGPSLLPSLDAIRWCRAGNKIEIDDSHLHELHRILSYVSKAAPM
ncbi:hypothetical protein FRC01_000480 [Tulasnella sp. 417]|nr:hypothetical protein FRC01_000480 [Tulasnella sp. 417]